MLSLSSQSEEQVLAGSVAIVRAALEVLQWVVSSIAVIMNKQENGAHLNNCIKMGMRFAHDTRMLLLQIRNRARISQLTASQFRLQSIQLSGQHW